MSDVVVQLVERQMVAAISGAQGPKGDPGGNVESAGTFLDLVGGTTGIPAGTQAVRTSGYAAAGDGGEALFVVVASEPTYATKFQSADGRWWQPSKAQTITDAIFGGNETDNVFTALQEAIDFARDQGVSWVVLAGPRLLCGEITLHDGVNLDLRTGLTRMNQVTSTVTSATVLSGSSTTIPAANGNVFAIGDPVMFVKSGGAVAVGDVIPNNPYAHVMPTVTAKSALSITIANNGATGTVPLNATVATCGRLILAQGNNRIILNSDGNEANQSFGYWISHAEILVVGSNVTVEGQISNTISEGMLVAGPESELIYDLFASKLRFENIGGNCLHWGNHYRSVVDKLIVVGCNKRYSDTGIDITLQHQGGALDLSNDCGEIAVGVAYIEDAICPVGEIGSTRSVDPDILNDDVVFGTLFCKNVYRPFEVRSGSRRVSCGLLLAKADVPYLTYAGGVSGSVIEVYGHATLTEDRPQQVMLSNANLTNVRVDVYQCNNAKFSNILIDGSDTNALGLSMFKVTDSRDVTLDNVEIRQGAVGFHLVANENGMTGVRLKSCNAYDQKFNGILTVLTGTATTMDVVIGQDCDVRASASLSNAAWVGMTLVAGVKEWWNSISAAVGSAYVGKTRRTQNSQGTRVDGAFANDIPFAAYSSTYHAFVAGANGVITGPVSDVYSGTVSGGTADTWRHVGRTTTYSDAETNLATLRIVPKESSGTYRGMAGLTDAPDPTTIDPFNGIDYGWLFFNGNANVIEIGNNRTSGVAYAANDVFWVVRTTGNDIEYWKGGDGVTHTTGTLVFTSISGVDEVDNLRGKVSIRNGTGAIEVKMFG